MSHVRLKYNNVLEIFLISECSTRWKEGWGVKHNSLMQEENKSTQLIYVDFQITYELKPFVINVIVLSHKIGLRFVSKSKITLG